MIYLLGVDHQIQWDRDLLKSQKFITYVELIISEKQISVIGEEFFPEIFTTSSIYKKKKIKKTLLKTLAIYHNIIHLYCDPNVNQRKKLGILDCDGVKKLLNIPPTKRKINFNDEEREKYITIKKLCDNTRELFWLNVLCPYLIREVLFICGVDHIQSFKDILISKDRTVEILPVQYIL